MQITEVRIKIMDDRSGNDRILGFASVVIDAEFAIRDLKIIEGRGGRFLSMPDRKLMDRCSGCRSKNHLLARYCNHCGLRLDEYRATREADGRAKLHADICHPIHAGCRSWFTRAIMDAYDDEVLAAKLPGYASRYDDIGGGEFDFSNPN